MNTIRQSIFQPQAFSTPVSQYRKHLRSVKPPKTAKASVCLGCSRKASPAGPRAVRAREPGPARRGAAGARGDGGARSRRGATRGLPRGNFLAFPPHALGAILAYLLQPRLGVGLLTRLGRRKLLGGTVLASWLMLLSRRYFNLKKHE